NSLIGCRRTLQRPFHDKTMRKFRRAPAIFDFEEPKIRDCCLKPFRDRRTDNLALLETAGCVECRVQLGWCSRRRIWSKRMHELGSTQCARSLQAYRFLSIDLKARYVAELRPAFNASD